MWGYRSGKSVSSRKFFCGRTGRVKGGVKFSRTRVDPVRSSRHEIYRSNKKRWTQTKVEEILDRYVDMSTDICHDVFGLTGPNRENAGVSRYLGKF